MLVEREGGGKAEIATDAWLKVPNKATRREHDIWLYIYTVSYRRGLHRQTYILYLSLLHMYMINKEDKAN